MAMTVIPVCRAEAALGERPPDRRAVVRHGNPLDRELPERHLELLDDLRTLVRAADHSAELARLVVVEPDDRRRLVVMVVPEEVDLAHTVVVQHDRQASAFGCPKAVLDADARQSRLSQLDRHA